jgi:sulfur carrier protein
MKQTNGQTMADVIEKTLTVNGVSEPLDAPTVAALLAARDIAPDGRGVAVAVNGALVRRADWATTALNAGDTVEIVRAMQGG